MAESKNNVVTHGLSGLVGDMLVFKNRHGKTFVSSKPKERMLVVLFVLRFSFIRPQSFRALAKTRSTCFFLIRELFSVHLLSEIVSLSIQ